MAAPDEAGNRPALRRWLWFVGLWAAGVGVTGLVGAVIKFWLR